MRASHQRVIDRLDQYYLLSGDQVLRGHPPWVFSEKNTLPKGWRKYDFQGRQMLLGPAWKVNFDDYI